ncbi:MAG: hypothetical protein PHC75_05690 [Burkholderiales bacterium]|nr:hypothetical protein [Burkholderiales bacterium]
MQPKSNSILQRTTPVMILKFLFLISLNAIILAYANSIFSLKLSVDLYSKYAFLVSNAGVVAIFLTMGFDMSASKYFSSYIHNNNYALAKGFTHTALIQILKSSAVFIVLAASYWLMEPFLANLFETYFHTHIFKGNIIIGLIVAIFIAALNILIIILRCLSTPLWGYFLSVVLPTLLILVAAITLPVIVKTEADFNHVMMFYGIAYLVAVAACVAILILLIRSKPHYLVKMEIDSNWFKISKVMMVYSFIIMLSNVIPINILQLYQGVSVNSAQMATFAYSYSVLYLLFSIPPIMTKTILNPKFAPLHSSGQYSELQKIIINSNRLSLAFNFSLVYLGIVFHKFIINLLSNQFSDILIISLLIALSFMLDFSINASRSALLLLGNEKSVMKNRAIVVILQLFLSLIVGYYWGVYGVCIALILIRNISSVLMILELKTAGYRSF